MMTLCPALPSSETLYWTNFKTFGSCESFTVHVQIFKHVNQVKKYWNSPLIPVSVSIDGALHSKFLLQAAD